MKFDYLIAGGGTTGLLLANRLSADPTTTVAIIEPGLSTRNNPNVADPAAFNTPIDWAYPTTPQRRGRQLQLHSGKGLGGTSTINGMTYIRADAAEIDAWAALGSAGWDWAGLLRVGNLYSLPNGSFYGIVWDAWESIDRVWGQSRCE